MSVVDIYPFYVILEDGTMFTAYVQSAGAAALRGERLRAERGKTSPITAIVRLDSPLWTHWTQPVRRGFWAWLTGGRVRS